MGGRLQSHQQRTVFREQGLLHDMGGKSKHILGEKLKSKAMANKRDNLLYRLRKKGVQANPRKRVIFFGVGGEPFKIRQIRRLCSEFHFNVQLVIE